MPATPEQLDRIAARLWHNGARLAEPPSLSAVLGVEFYRRQRYAHKPSSGQQGLFNEKDHPRGQPENAGQFIEKETQKQPKSAAKPKAKKTATKYDGPPATSTKERAEEALSRDFTEVDINRMDRWPRTTNPEQGKFLHPDGKYLTGQAGKRIGVLYDHPQISSPTGNLDHIAGPGQATSLGYIHVSQSKPVNSKHWEIGLGIGREPSLQQYSEILRLIVRGGQTNTPVILSLEKGGKDTQKFDEDGYNQYWRKGSTQLPITVKPGTNPDTILTQIRNFYAGIVEAPRYQGLAAQFHTREDYRRLFAEEYARRPAAGQRRLFREEDHPRGQPENKGEFVKKGEETKSKQPKTEQQPQPAPHVTETPEFKKRFGESLARDAEGNPLLLYSGGGEDLLTRDKTKDRPVFFTPNKDLAEWFSVLFARGKIPHLTAGYLYYVNPIELTPPTKTLRYPSITEEASRRRQMLPYIEPRWYDDEAEQTQFTDEAGVKLAKQEGEFAGKDAVIIRNVMESGHRTDVYIVRSPDQIIHAENPDIRYSLTQSLQAEFYRRGYPERYKEYPFEAEQRARSKAASEAFKPVKPTEPTKPVTPSTPSTPKKPDEPIMAEVVPEPKKPTWIGGGPGGSVKPTTKPTTPQPAADPEFERLHPRGKGPQGGQFVAKPGGSQEAKPQTGIAPKSPQKPAPERQGKVSLKGKDYEVEQHGGTWRYRTGEDGTWYQAGPESHAMIERAMIQANKSAPPPTKPELKAQRKQIGQTHLPNAAEALKTAKTAFEGAWKQHNDLNKKASWLRTYGRHGEAGRLEHAADQLQAHIKKNLGPALVRAQHAHDTLKARQSAPLESYPRPKRTPGPLFDQPRGRSERPTPLVDRAQTGGESRYPEWESHQAWEEHQRAKEAQRIANKGRPSLNTNTQAGQAIRQAAEDYGVQPEHLLDAAQIVMEGKQMHVREREGAKARAREMTGLSMQDLARVENAGYDYSSGWKVGGETGAKMAKLDEKAREFAWEHPGVIGNVGEGADTADLARDFWDLLREGAGRVPQIYDPDVLREAADMILKSGGQQQPERDPWDQEPVPFAKAGTKEKYRRWFQEEYARRAAPGQGSLFKEEDHPRGQPENAGEFVKKGEGMGKKPDAKITSQRPSQQPTPNTQKAAPSLQNVPVPPKTQSQQLTPEQRESLESWATGTNVNTFRKWDANPQLYETSHAPWIKAKYDLFRTTVKSLPNYKGTVYRGMQQVTPEEWAGLVNSGMKPGGTIDFKSHSSATKLEKEALEFSVGSSQPGDTAILFEIESQTGADLTPHMSHVWDYQQEVLVRPNTRFKVLQIFGPIQDKGVNLYKVNLQEIASEPEKYARLFRAEYHRRQVERYKRMMVEEYAKKERYSEEFEKLHPRDETGEFIEKGETSNARKTADNGGASEESRGTRVLPAVQGEAEARSPQLQMHLKIADEKTPASAIGYHYGDAGIGSDTLLRRMDAGRGTGHFGTGVYFFGSEKNAGSRADRPLTKIDLTGLNMARPRGDDVFKLHDGLRAFNRVIFRDEPLDFDKYTSRAHDAIFNVGFGLGFRKSDDAIRQAMERVAKQFKDGTNDGIRTPSTILMQELGYDGIDVRGTKADNGEYGSVIYPKP